MLAKHRGPNWLMVVMTAATMGVCASGALFDAISSNPASGGGLLGEYFASYDCHGVPAITRVDPQIDFDWLNDRPEPPIDDDYFSVRWSGYLIPLYTELYTVSVSGVYGPDVSIGDNPIEWILDGLELQGKVELTGGQAYPIEIVHEGAYHGGNIQLLWQSPSQAREIIPAGALRPPLKTSHPLPSDGKADVPRDAKLQWTLGARATHHDIYLGVDPNDVASATTTSTGVYRGRQDRDAITFTPGLLHWNTTYYWRIDEVNDADPNSPWKGEIWRFTTADFLVVDDFESYTDDVDANEAIWQTWIDGLAGNGTGSIVGYMSTVWVWPAAHTGQQDMPFNYDNSVPPYYSEAYRVWETPQDWTIGGGTDLSLWLKGQSAAFIEDPNGRDDLYVALEDDAGRLAISVHPDPAAVNVTEWTQWRIPLADFAASGVDVAAVKELCLGVGNRDNPQPDGTGMIHIDDIAVIKR